MKNEIKRIHAKTDKTALESAAELPKQKWSDEAKKRQAHRMKIKSLLATTMQVEGAGVKRR